MNGMIWGSGVESGMVYYIFVKNFMDGTTFGNIKEGLD